MSEKGKSAPYQYLESGVDLVFCLAWFCQEGLSFFLYNDPDQARTSAEEKSRQYGYEIDLGETEDIHGFLEQAAARGFVGAVLNDQIPVIFCTSDSGNPGFLRMFKDAEEGSGRIEMLREDGTWDVDAEIEMMSPVINQRLFDQLLVEMLGRLPFRGHTPQWSPLTYSPVGTDQLPFTMPSVDTGSAPVLDGSSSPVAGGRPFIPIFSTFEFMEAYVTSNDMDPTTLYRREIKDLPALARMAVDQNAYLLLNPGQNRADTAAIGFSNEQLALRSYSGRWVSDDGKVYRQSGSAAGAASDPAEKNGRRKPKTLADEMAELRDERQRQEGAGDGTASRKSIENDEAEMAGMPPGNLETRELDQTLDLVEIRVKRDQVASGILTTPLSYLCSAFNKPQTLIWAQGRFHFSFPDFETDLPLYTRQEIQGWLKSLDKIFPVLPYFLARVPGGQLDVVAALLDAEEEEGKPVLDPREIEAYVEDRCLMILSMGEKYGVDCRAACRDLVEALGVSLEDDFFLPLGGESR